MSATDLEPQPQSQCSPSHSYPPSHSPFPSASPEPELYSHPLCAPSPVPSSDDADLCFALQPGQYFYTHRVLFHTDDLDATGEFSPRGLEIHVPFFGALAFKRLQMATSSLADYPKIVDALTQRPLETRDFTIVVKSSDTEKELDRIPVHRGLLAARIPYFRALFSSGFKDSSEDEATLWDDVVTVSAARRVVGWCVLDFNTVAPGISSVTEALDLAVAADYLGVEDLRSFALASAWSTVRRCPRRCDMCFESIPAFLEGVEARPVLRDRLEEGVKMCLRILAAPQGVGMWKRPLIALPDDVLRRLVETVEGLVAKESSEGAYKLFLSVSKLAVKVKTSAVRARWVEMLLHPAMDACARVAAAQLGDGYLAGRVRRLQKVIGFEKSAVDEFLECIAGKVERGNAKVLWLGLATGNMPDVDAVRKAREVVRKWWKNEWLSIAVAGEFAEWGDEERTKLAGELEIAVEDLGENRKVRGTRGGGTSRDGRGRGRGS